MSYYAHSPKDGYSAQLYETHITSVVNMASEFAGVVAGHGKKDGRLLQQLAKASAQHHDLGKLESENQLVLSGEQSAHTLPYHHQDAGVAHFFKGEHLTPLAAVVVAAHHKGLTDFSSEKIKRERAFRDEEFHEKTDLILSELEVMHNSIFAEKPAPCNEMPSGDTSVFLRLLLSCLVDADHTNTARHYGKYPQHEESPDLKPTERLAALNTYVAGLNNGETETDEQRVALQKEMYFVCRDTDVSASITSCDSPVGSGKTTAVMAHLLAQAEKRGLRRIFVILPYTNIIQQSVDIYRKALVLPGENPHDVVAEVHHRADFETEEARHLSALWRAPIIVTTAVAFFETLASNMPATLRRLHELPGSAVFVDESHAALPAKLLPIAWRWMNIFSDEWNCYWVLASGSLCRFWQIKEIAQNSNNSVVPEIVGDDLRKRLGLYEQNRISYKYDLKPKSTDEFVEWIANSPGPRLVILNTVQSAAVLATAYADRFGRENTEHLSTALTPNDREMTLERVKQRLTDKNDNNWTLFATSCVEAGVNLSFRIGFREVGSLVSLLQIAGRINRGGKGKDAEVWSFVLKEDDMLINNPGLKDAAEILHGYFMKNKEITPDLSTKSISDEIRLRGVSGIYEKLLQYEDVKDFFSIDRDFMVIDSNTHLAIVDPAFADCIRDHNDKIDWRLLQRHSVQIIENKLSKTNSQLILPGIYHWSLGYNDFIGYMEGVIKSRSF